MLRPIGTIMTVTLSIGMVVAVVGANAAPTEGQDSNRQYVGSDTCAECHDATEYGVHSRLGEFERWVEGSGCESCHGPGSAHVESTEISDIGAFSELSANESTELCTSCHRQDTAMHWAGSEHALIGMACVDCHVIHETEPEPYVRFPGDRLTSYHQAAAPRKASLKAPEDQLCSECHQDVSAQMQYPSHHPVREGFMTCGSCHNVHGNISGLIRSDERVNDLCYECHTNHQGPFIFEHPPVEEDCSICHAPHGSVANFLLKQNEPFLCLQCHETHFHTARVSAEGPYGLESGSATNPLGKTSFMAAYGTKCSQCHVQIHGSDLPSQAVSGRGKALTR